MREKEDKRKETWEEGKERKRRKEKEKNKKTTMWPNMGKKKFFLLE